MRYDSIVAFCDQKHLACLRANLDHYNAEPLLGFSIGKLRLEKVWTRPFDDERAYVRFVVDLDAPPEPRGSFSGIEFTET